MPRPLVAAIDIGAMRANLTIAKRYAPHAKVWAVIKANAYGHGLERAMRGFADADGLALVEPDAAVRLRELGWQKPILLLEGFFDAADLTMASKLSIDVVVHCHEQIDLIEKANLVAPVNIHLKMNSGMNRLGFTPDVFRAMHARLQANPVIRSITLMTHFANADVPDKPGMPFFRQLHYFQDAIADLPGERSIANSATDLLHSNVPADWIRPGIMLYGATPGSRTAAEFGLQPAMTLTSEIIGIQDIPPHAAVGYGSRFVSEKPMTIGVVACGYADGYPRHAPDGTPVVVDGIRTRIVGRVSMDMITVDLTPVPNARVGSKVVLWGKNLPIDEVAEAAGTIGYELMCALAPRVRVIEV
jgi:alanine racemase